MHSLSFNILLPNHIHLLFPPPPPPFLSSSPPSPLPPPSQCLRPGSAPEDEATTSADIGKMVNGLNARYAREGGERYVLSSLFLLHVRVVFILHDGNTISLSFSDLI